MWKVNGRLEFRKHLNNPCTKMLQNDNSRSLAGNLQSDQNSITWNLELGFCPPITTIVEARNSLIQEKHIRNEICVTVKLSRRNQKVEIYLQMNDLVLDFFSTDLGHVFGSAVSNELGVMLREKDLTNQNLIRTLSAYTLSWYTRTWLSTISLATRRSY